jgi:hypothetical protein
VEPDDPFWGPEPVERVLAHEEKYWRLTAPPGEDRQLLRACVAVATLAGADTYEEAEGMLATIPALGGPAADERRRTMVQWLAWFSAVMAVGGILLSIAVKSGIDVHTLPRLTQAKIGFDSSLTSD